MSILICCKGASTVETVSLPMAPLVDCCVFFLFCFIFLDNNLFFFFVILSNYEIRRRSVSMDSQ